jgi:lipopolysaccharide transport system permease protein
MGYSWLFLPPIATTLVWLFLNSSGVIKVAETNMPYPAFVMTGVLIWQAFMESLLKPMSSLSGARTMLIKLNFPRIAPILAGTAGTLLNSSIRLLLLIPIFVHVGLKPSWTITLFPLIFLCIVIFGTSIGLLLAPVGMLYTDVSRGIGFLGQFGMYATPVIYPAATTGLLAWINAFNPLTYLLDTARSSLVGEGFNHLGISLAIMTFSLILLILSWMILHITIPRIIERLGM